MHDEATCYECRFGILGGRYQPVAVVWCNEHQCHCEAGDDGKPFLSQFGHHYRAESTLVDDSFDSYFVLDSDYSHHCEPICGTFLIVFCKECKGWQIIDGDAETSIPDYNYEESSCVCMEGQHQAALCEDRNWRWMNPRKSYAALLRGEPKWNEEA